MGLGVAYEPTAAWPALNPIFGRLVDEIHTNPAPQVALFLPVLVTAPVFGFVCGLLLAAFG